MCGILYTYLHIHVHTPTQSRNGHFTCSFLNIHVYTCMVIYICMYMCGHVHVQWSVCYVGFWCSAKATSLYLLKLPMRSTHPTSLSHYLLLSPSPFLRSSVPPLSLPSPPPLPPSLPPSLPLHQPGFDVNATSMNRRNALHYAADYGQVEVVKLLLEKGAKIDVSNIHVHVQSCIITCIYMYMYEVLC